MNLNFPPNGLNTSSPSVLAKMPMAGAETRPIDEDGRLRPLKPEYGLFRLAGLGVP